MSQARHKSVQLLSFSLFLDLKPQLNQVIQTVYLFGYEMAMTQYKHTLASLSLTIGWQRPHMTVSTKNATPLKASKSRNSDSSVQIPIKPKSQAEFVPRDAEECEFVDLAGFEDAAFSMEAVIQYAQLAV